MTDLSIQRYQFNCQTLAPLAFNDYSGSMLRGAFGHSLRTLSCLTKMENCTQCMLYRQCSYPAIFEPPAPVKSDFQAFNHIPSPYIIEPPVMGQKQLAKNESFSFNLVLIGSKAIAQLPLIIIAWERALQQGLGKDHTSVKLNNIIFEPKQAIEQMIYHADSNELISPPAFDIPALEPVDKISIQLLTPLRIQQKKRILANEMLAKDLLMALVRRYYLLQEFYTLDYLSPDFSKFSKQASQIQGYANFKRHDWLRYSTRQRQKIKLTGVMGEIELKGNLAPFLKLLNIGQWLHIGKNTTFGMGRYSLK